MKRSVRLRYTICNHPARPQIDLTISTGVSKRAVAEGFGCRGMPCGVIRRRTSPGDPAKSTRTAAVALHTAIHDPGFILLVSPSLRQSKELFAKVTGFLKDLESTACSNRTTRAAVHQQTELALSRCPATPTHCGATP